MAIQGSLLVMRGCGCALIRPDHTSDFVDIRYCPLHAAAADLLEAVRETREAAAACFRAFVTMEDGSPDRKNQAILENEMLRAGVRNGFGLRADMAINAAIGNIEEWKRLKEIEQKRIADERREANVQ